MSGARDGEGKGAQGDKVLDLPQFGRPIRSSVNIRRKAGEEDNEEGILEFPPEYRRPSCRGNTSELPRICMVSDFFHPGLGGVEIHIMQLAQCLILRGYRVIVITHFRGNRHGVRYLTGGLKVYYLPFIPFHDNCTLPTVSSFFPLLRKILLRERIDVVHGHQATSNLTHECLLHARSMGLRTVYTDHSLFGFADMACIHINKVLKFYLAEADHCICVSHTSRENLVLRAGLDPSRVAAIPNALDPTRFVPDISTRPKPPRINIVVLSRLTFRKGVDLLVGLISLVCERHPNVNFVIGGDGPKRLEIEELREKRSLHDRVEMLGAVRHADVTKVLNRGHIFVNCSLTEAFCIAIVEAACCGLFVVSTNVGGIGEVLPPDMTALAEPNAESLAEAVDIALHELPKVDPWEYHRAVRAMYSWHDVARRTEKVYRKVLDMPKRALIDRLAVVFDLGTFSGILFSLVVAFDHLVWLILEWLCPKENVEIAPDFPYEEFEEWRKEAFSCRVKEEG